MVDFISRHGKVLVDPELDDSRFRKCEPLTDDDIEETPKSKGLTPDQKKLHWENYAKTTERQELVFKKVFDNVFDEQRDFVVSELERTGKLPASLDDTKTAQKFQPAIELVYHDSFESAV